MRTVLQKFTVSGWALLLLTMTGACGLGGGSKIDSGFYRTSGRGIDDDGYERIIGISKDREYAWTIAQSFNGSLEIYSGRLSESRSGSERDDETYSFTEETAHISRAQNGNNGSINLARDYNLAGNQLSFELERYGKDNDRIRVQVFPGGNFSRNTNSNYGLEEFTAERIDRDEVLRELERAASANNSTTTTNTTNFTNRGFVEFRLRDLPIEFCRDMFGNDDCDGVAR